LNRGPVALVSRNYSLLVAIDAQQGFIQQRPPPLSPVLRGDPA
jgi:hypothetical protein